VPCDNWRTADDRVFRESEGVLTGHRDDGKAGTANVNVPGSDAGTVNSPAA